jgi:hypothetical protein
MKMSFVRLTALCFGISFGQWACHAAEQTVRTQPATRPSETGAADAHVVFLKPPAGITRVSFVCDAPRLQRFAELRRQLAITIAAMPPSEKFGLVFMRDRSCIALDVHLIEASAKSKSRTNNFLEQMDVLRGDEDPIPALELAFKQDPQLIYLVALGDFTDNAAVIQKIRELNKDHKVRINTVLFTIQSDGDLADITKLLEAIASENQGAFNHVDEGDL